MTLRRIFESTLAHASYMVGDSGQAVIVDPNRDIEGYMALAAEEGLRIVAVAETHIHADYASGAFELAERAGAKLYVSDEGPQEWKYAFATSPSVVPVRDGDTFAVGKLTFEVVATPGHTPEHIAFVLADGSGPIGAFTGDFLFVGDVGRPDLLERAAGIAGTMEAGGRNLFRTIQKFVQRFPSEMLIWPAHGAGSACGKSLGDVPVSSLGIERRTNWAFQIDDEERFVREILAGQPEPPVYFKEMKRINKEFPAFGSPNLARLPGSQVVDALSSEAYVVDLRTPGEVAIGSLSGALHLPLDRSFTTWAGWLLPYDREILLVASSLEQAETAAARLALIGITKVVGWSGSEALRAYERKHGTLALTPQVSPAELFARTQASEVEVVDVRGASEFAAGHLPGATHIFLGRLPARLEELPRNRPIVVHCAGGSRTPVAASVLQRAGFDNVIAFPGGTIDWAALGYPLEAESSVATGA